jgi:hypothetical protein
LAGLDGRDDERHLVREVVGGDVDMADVSMSLDGFTAGPNVRQAEPTADGGERLHGWMDGKGPDGEIDLDVRREVDATVGAAVIGRRTFDLGVGPWGGTPWPGVPSFVVTHWARPDLLGDNGFDGEQAELIAEGKPVTGTVTHLRLRIAKA